MKRILSLDALRGYAILLVLFQHFPMVINNRIIDFMSKIGFAINSGYLGVQIFFVLSGFLITRILIKEKKNNDVSFTRFYLKRMLRIFPIYYLSIIVFGILITWKDSTAAFFYISNYWFISHNRDSHLIITWSLAVEEHFYLFWPLIIYKLDLKTSKTIIKYILPAIALIGTIFTIGANDHEQAAKIVGNVTNIQILSLCLGSYLAYIENKIISLKINEIWLLVGALIVLLVVGKFFNLASQSAVYSFAQYISPLMKLLAYASFGVAVTILFININNSSVFAKIITNKPVKFIGKISYGIYLYHFPIFCLLNMTTFQAKSITLLQCIEGLSLSLIVATASFYIIELPLLKLKDSLTSKFFNKKKELIIADR